MEIEGVPQSKLDRLWKHLLKAEELTGGKLLIRGFRISMGCCPIYTFAPEVDKDGRSLIWATKEGSVRYGSNKFYHIYKRSDSKWFLDLPQDTAVEINSWCIKKIKEHYNG